MSDAIRAWGSLVLEGIAANPLPWLLGLALSVVGAAALAGVRRAAWRRLLVVVWALLPALLPGGWLATCDTNGATGGEACFAPGFALALGLAVLPVWLVGTVAGATLRRRAARR